MRCLKYKYQTILTVSFICFSLGMVPFLEVQTLDHNWEMVTPACIPIHPSGEVEED